MPAVGDRRTARKESNISTTPHPTYQLSPVQLQTIVGMVNTSCFGTLSHPFRCAFSSAAASKNRIILKVSLLRTHAAGPRHPHSPPLRPPTVSHSLTRSQRSAPNNVQATRRSLTCWRRSAANGILATGDGAPPRPGYTPKNAFYAKCKNLLEQRKARRSATTKKMSPTFLSSTVFPPPVQTSPRAASAPVRCTCTFVKPVSSNGHVLS